MAKLNEIMSLLKTNVNFKPLSENYYSGSTYLVEAEGFNMMGMCTFVRNLICNNIL